MHTFYEGHDKAYRAKRNRGEAGWDAPEVSAENFARIQSILPPLSENAEPEILDLGCGSGELSFHYRSLSSHVTGVDIAQTAIHWAREKLPEFTFLCGNLLDPHILPANHFEITFDSNCLHCIIGEDRQTLLSNVHHWVKPGGFLVIHTMCNGPVGKLRKGFCRTDRIIYQGRIATRYLGTAEDIIREIEASGFRTVKKNVINQPGEPDILVGLHRKPHSPESSPTGAV